MGTTISSGRWKLDYTNRRVYRDTAITPTVVDTTLDLYSDLQDTFDEPGQMDDTVPMSAQTPTEFTIGGTDPDFAWFISPSDTKYLRGGAITTSGWTRTPTTENGIVRVPYDGTTDPVASDIGKTITHAVDSDTGVLVGFDATDGYLYIRPADDTAANNFDSTSGNLNVTGGTAGVGAQTAAADSGEYLWANPNSVGVFSVQDGTRGFVYQDGAKITNWPAGIGLNADGEFDILLLVQAAGTLIDSGFATFFARRGGALGDWFESNLSNGGRVTIPLTGNPNTVNDGVGHHNATWTGGSGATLVVGEIVSLNSDTERAAVVANVTTPGAATGDFDYFLIRGLTQFVTSDAVTAETSGKTMTIGTVTNLTPVTDTGVTLTHGATTQDINNGAGVRPYSIRLDPATLSWERVYRRLQYITRRGSTEPIDGVNGESYRGSTRQIEYSGQAGGNWTEGTIVYDQTTGAQGLIVADHDDGTSGDLILRATRGTFGNGNTIGDAPSAPTVTATIAASPRTIPTLKFAPLGNLAGTLFQAAPGMVPVLANIAPGREQDYSLIDDDGITQTPPNTVPVAITSVAVDDWVSVFRLDAPFTSGGQIVKNEYTSDNTLNVAGDATFEVTTTISQEAPPAGVIRVAYDVDLEDRYNYSSFSGTTFTLTAIPNSTVSAGGADPLGITLTDTTATFQTDGVVPGMIVRNTTDGSYGYVKSVTSETVLVLDGNGLTGGTEDDWDDGDAYTINKLRQTYDNTDTVYVPFLDVKVPSGTSVSTTIIQSVDIDVLIRVRQGRVILPYQAPNTIGSNGLSAAAIRTPDPIAT